ncbi:MAG: hypothetical protein ABIJ97_13215, partial [Bacteroidota bacterium]
NYNNTHIELGMDGNLYYINKGNGSDNGSISRFTNPDDPGNSAWITNNYGINNIRVSNYQYGNSDSDARYIFADQIDGENYEDYFQTVNSLCCNDHFEYDKVSEIYPYTYIYTNPITKDITVTSYGVPQVWTPSQNPFGTDAEVFLESNLIINHGVDLTISGMTFKFETGKNLKLLGGGGGVKGAKLTINSTTLTAYDACDVDDKMWGGVRLLGTGTSQYPVNNTAQPLFIMKNNSLIEYAEIGINSDYGGIIQAENSEFKDNLHAIGHAFLLPTTNQAPHNLMNASYVDLCDFRTTEKLYILKNQYPNTFVAIDWTTRFNLRGVTMNNEYGASVFDVNKRGNGIRSTFSQIKLCSYCDNPSCSNEIRSEITNLNFGATIRGGSGSKFDHAIFKSCVKGIQLKEDANDATVIRNDFKVYNNEDPSYNYVTYGAYGLSIEESTNYTVEGNHFHDGIAGAFAINTGIDQNEIHKNYFYDLKNSTNQTGMIATEENSNYKEIGPTGDNGIQGLNIRCNNFNKTDYAIAVIDGTIGKHQTGSDNVGPSGNWFAHDHLVNGDTDYLIEINPGNIQNYNPNDYVDIYTYIQHDQSSVWNLLLDWHSLYDHTNDYYTYPKIQIGSSPYSETDFDKACPSKIAGGTVVVGEISNQISALSNEIEKKKNELVGLVDGGKTESLLQMLNTTVANNYVSNCNELLSYSPYLSDTVLIAFMKIDHMGHPIIKTDVLLTNSPLPYKAKKEFENFWLPPPYYETVVAAQTGINPVTVKEMEIVSIESNIHNLKKTMISGALNDTIPEKLDSVITFLENQTGYKALYDLIPIYIKLYRFDDANIALEKLLTETGNNGFLKEKAVHYKALKNIEMQILNAPGNEQKIIESNYDFLKSLAQIDYGYENSMARSILEFGGYLNFPKKYPLPSITKSARIEKPVNNMQYNNIE